MRFAMGSTFTAVSALLSIEINWIKTFSTDVCRRNQDMVYSVNFQEKPCRVKINSNTSLDLRIDMRVRFHARPNFTTTTNQDRFDPDLTPKEIISGKPCGFSLITDKIRLNFSPFYNNNVSH